MYKKVAKFRARLVARTHKVLAIKSLQVLASHFNLYANSRSHSRTVPVSCSMFFWCFFFQLPNEDDGW